MAEKPFSEWTEEELAAWEQKRRAAGGIVYYCSPVVMAAAKKAGLDMRQWEVVQPLPTRSATRSSS